MTNAERQRRYIERLKAKAVSNDGGDAELKAACAKLEQELAQAKRMIAELNAEIVRQAQNFRAESRVDKPKTARFAMPPPLRNGISKLLHTDTRNNVSDDDKEELCKQWNAWNDANSDKAKPSKRRRW